MRGVRYTSGNRNAPMQRANAPGLYGLRRSTALPEYTYIYALVDPRTGTVRYVGKANDPRNRLKHHIYKAQTERTYKARWLTGLRKAGLRPELLILEKVTVEGWQARERYWIAVLPGLTNGSAGGDGVDAPRTPEWAAKIGAAHKGKAISPEMREKLRAANLRAACKYGHPYTPENTHVDSRGHRICRECDLVKSRRKRAKRKEHRGR